MSSVAYALFTSENSHWLSRMLHPRLRHVWVILPDEGSGQWVGCNVSVTGFETFVVGPLETDIVAHYAALGYLLVAVPYPGSPAVRWPVLLNSCVGWTKALLGIQHWAWTPAQLHRHLLKDVPHAALDLARPGRQPA